eukprot:94344-Prymnesium_polylepis.1
MVSVKAHANARGRRGRERAAHAKRGVTTRTKGGSIGKPPGKMTSSLMVACAGWRAACAASSVARGEPSSGAMSTAHR